MNKSRYTDRRTVLKTIGAVAVGVPAVSGSAAARGNVVSQIDSSGHWAYFPLGQEHWGRQKHPYDLRLGDSRWMAEPAPGGAVRALAKNITTPDTFPNRNTGFDIHMGPLGDIETISVTSRTVRTVTGDAATLFVGLYLDTNDDGEFFHWEKIRGDRESAIPGPGGDDEGLLFTDADGTFTISDETTLFIFTRGGFATLGELKSGEVEDIDGSTASALYLGVVDDTPETSGVDEAIVQSVNIQKS